MTTECHICRECRENLDAAGMKYEEIAGAEKTCPCEFCGAKRFCKKLIIQYGGKQR